MSVILQLQDYGLRYAGQARSALSGVSFALQPGQRLAVIGESGSGKTTLARGIAGLLPPNVRQTGQILWPQGPMRPGQGIGYLFQDPGASLNPVLSIGAQLSEVIRTHQRLSRTDAKAEAVQLLQRMGIAGPEKALSAFAHQFSGGQRQRIGLALALAGRPQILIADEPTSGLDMLAQARIHDLLLDLTESQNLTLIMITHDLALASQLGQQILVLHHGEVADFGPAAQVIASPRSAYTQALLQDHLDLASPSLIGASA